MSGRDDTCVRCAKEPGIYECANCREFPLCQGCVDELAKDGWRQHTCFCVVPKHAMSLINYPSDSEDEDECSGWAVGTRSVIEIIEEDQ